MVCSIDIILWHIVIYTFLSKGNIRYFNIAEKTIFHPLFYIVSSQKKSFRKSERALNIIILTEKKWHRLRFAVPLTFK